MPTLAILEELHRHRTLRLYRTWRGKIEKRGGQIVAISTAGEPDGEFEEVRLRMRQEASQKKTTKGHIRAASKTYVLHEYAVPDGKSPDVMKDVKLANPLKAITLAQLKRKYTSPSMTPSHWRRFACGIPAGLDDQPITADVWDRLRVDIGGIEEGEPVVIVPSVGHNAAIAIAASRSEERVAIRVEVLEPEEGTSILVRTEDRLVELCERYMVDGIYHPLGSFVRSPEILAPRVNAPLIQAPQSPAALTAASGTFNRLLKSGRLMHDGDMTLRGHALSATQKTSETGERYEITDRARGLIAAVFATHYVNAQPLEPYIGLPSEVG
jgi:hypothetical protein